MSAAYPHATPTYPHDAESRLVDSLRTVDFPATKDDLLQVAVIDHLEVSTIGALRELPHGDYSGVAEVLRALGAGAFRSARRVSPISA
jgi:hypothetical protein